jgi:hypothetical protein
VNDNRKQTSELLAGMAASIQAFDCGQLAIDRLAWELKSRIAALRQIADEGWADEMKEIWNRLEFINAVFIESGQEALSTEERKEADEVLNELRAAIRAY